ncbi:MAG: protein kinase, partial [Chlamydiia bacterium]|nr:protein kinase [Chlamydiia bacterium]
LQEENLINEQSQLTNVAELAEKIERATTFRRPSERTELVNELSTKSNSELFANGKQIFYKLTRYPFRSGGFKQTFFGYSQGDQRLFIVSSPVQRVEGRDLNEYRRSVIEEQERDSNAINILKSDMTVDLKYFLIPEIAFKDDFGFEHRFSEFCDIGTFDALKNYSLRDRIDPILQCIKGFKYLHRSLIHRDIKPENILLYTREDGQIGVVISDFGLSVRIGEKGIAGTPTYFATELLLHDYLKIEGNSTIDSDLFALGLTIGEVLLNISIAKNIVNTGQLRDLHFKAMDEEISLFNVFMIEWKKNPKLNTSILYQSTVNTIYQMTEVDIKKRSRNTDELFKNLTELSSTIDSNPVQFPNKVPDGEQMPVHVRVQESEELFREPKSPEDA